MANLIFFCHFYSAYFESNLQGYSIDIFLSFAGGSLGPSGPLWLRQCVTVCLVVSQNSLRLASVYSFLSCMFWLTNDNDLSYSSRKSS